MSSNFQKTTSNFFVTFLIGLIVVSFMFTGYESMKGSPNAVAKVGSYPITAREYQMEYNRQINFFKNAIFGGKDLSSQDIEKFGIKDTALRNLVQAKLQLEFANRAGITAAPTQIKETIKRFDFFQTNGQFDINKYKSLLAANGLSPADFESDITNQVFADNAQTLFSKYPVSDRYIDEIGRFKAMRFNANVAEVKEEALRKFIDVSQQEINEYLKNEANKARTENLFKERKATLDVPEKLKASHILITTPGGESEKAEKKIKEIAKEVTPSNFKKMANKYTEDPTGKGKGGSLGIFGRGRMVPEFERVAFQLRPGSVSEPVKTNFGYHLIYVEKKIEAKEAKYTDFEKEIAIELIRQSKEKELKELMKEVSEKLAAAIKARNMKEVANLKKKYGFDLDENVQFNRFEGSLGQINIAAEQTKDIFSGLKDKEANFYNFALAGKTLIVAIEKSFDKDLPVFDREKEKNGLQMVLSNKIKQAVLKEIGDEVAVKQFVNL
ncbi:MAG: SurA N-terminal domain-containing protein [Bacteriovoracaceae bacterium]|nr:SurA N-terminal domain-containing protein [Bacteriovoracaceae bacterium]